MESDDFVTEDVLAVRERGRDLDLLLDVRTAHGAGLELAGRDNAGFADLEPLELAGVLEVGALAGALGEVVEGRTWVSWPLVPGDGESRACGHRDWCAIGWEGAVGCGAGDAVLCGPLVA